MTVAALRQAVLCTLAVLLAVVSGCAEKGPILIEGIKYQPPEGVTATTTPTIVAVSPFRDQRDKPPATIGLRQVRDLFSNDLVIQVTTTDLVSAAISDALAVRGIGVKTATVWDLGEASIKAEGADVLIGGEIKTLWVDVTTQPFQVKYRANVHLRVQTADVKTGKIVRTLNLNSSLEREDISYSDALVQEMLAETLSSAINQLLNDDEVKKVIH